MTELLLDILCIGPLLDQERGEGMAQIMESDMTQTGGLQTAVQGLSQRADVHPLAGGTKEYPLRYRLLL